ncbi:MAG: tRNA (guanosine(37)-N1)-methyltransferase TrmD [Candidatus Yanofskybacteria bacterium RIFCSPLOWO2_01_FULL_49_25]|uniref:tRNA (guanine-N(1)-)-methyltransferase n=1 Tax=Candidatus Yanofskybacteria bacterium RIFCSPLOWO2_01_FULL_49_25 TaxID=1802701 RepID=A0A1F8GWN1_9BACT|nr:MAG: tRNA (guanosine(37)-N1)-methyltransferase TrmD [Candidatus Yanofskybacteria bacterium RIFCSPLOWO2_01_FULL_49_25]
MRFDVLTIFPDLFTSFKNEALIARAQAKKIISINTHFLREWGEGPHRKVDDRPYGGGAGMVMMTAPIAAAIGAVKRKAKSEKLKARTIVFSAKGKLFNQATAQRYTKLDQLIMICGRYEGVDERVAQHLADEEVSIGEYVLFGGEVPAMVVMEAVTRLLPGAVGKPASLKEESFSFPSDATRSTLHATRLEYPHYTRPEILKIDGKNRKVPPVLLSGDHKKIEEWRRKKAKIRTP